MNQSPALSPALGRATAVTAVRGEGAYLIGDDGRRYLDFTTGIGVTSTGHCHPKVVEAARRQAGELIHGQQTTVLHPRLVELAERLVGLTPDRVECFLFASAGAEAVEAAVRLARHATGRTNVIAFQGGFHGRTAGALSLTTSRVAFRAGLQPLMAGVVVAPFPDAHRYDWPVERAVEFCLAELDHILATQSAPAETAAVIIEPVLGEGGYVPTPPEFLRGVAERCRRHGIVFIVDEIQTGVGRTGRFWGYEHAGVEPDVITTAKGLASGFPLSAVGASRELMGRAWPGSQGGTYGGNAVSCAAALATLDVIESEGLVENAAERGRELIDGLYELQRRYPGRISDVRGLGLMVASELTDGPEQVKVLLRACEEHGLLLLPCGPYGNVVRWIPPLIVTSEQVADALDAFEKALAATGE